MPDVIVLTDRRYINPSHRTDYVENVLLEDKLVVDALRKRGLAVERKAWDENYNWSEAKTLLFRTTWDYFDRFEEFMEWFNTVSTKSQLINSEKLIRWNLNKKYLFDLKSLGINIPDSVLISKKSSLSLKKWAESLETDSFILKPCISGAARHTYLLKKEDLKDFESQFQALTANEDFLLQVFQKNVVEYGELSFICFGNTISHAVRKVAKSGDFRVQDDFGGSVFSHVFSQEEIFFVEKVLAACNEPIVYARVDILRDNKGQLALAELELIEPELWFRMNPKAADLLAQKVYQRLQEL